MAKTKRVTIRLDERQYNFLLEYAKKHGFLDTSETIRNIIAKEMKRERRKEKQGESDDDGEKNKREN